MLLTVVAFEPDTVTVEAPELTNMPVEFPGGISPPPAEEIVVAVEPETVSAEPPRVVVVVVVLTNGPGELGSGGITSPVPVETYVEVEPEMTIAVEPTMVVTFKLGAGKLPLGIGKLGVGTAPVDGGMMPLSPVEIAVAVEKNVVISPFPVVVDAGTTDGPNTPPPPTMIWVEDPRMIVVVAPLMIVVSSSVTRLAGKGVAGCCTTVWTMVLVHDQEVAYTACQ